jgi:hypothetical protein
VIVAIALVTALVGCGRLRGQSPGQSSGFGQAGTSQSASPDPIDRALDEVDAARQRLVAADAAVAKARAQLDTALATVAGLTGQPIEDQDLSQVHIRSDDHDWSSDDHHWGEMGRHFAMVGQRIAIRASRLAQVEAARAQREAQSEAARAMRDAQRELMREDRDDDDDSDTSPSNHCHCRGETDNR